MQRRISVSSTPHLALCPHVHAMPLHTRSAIVSCQERKLHLFLIVLASLTVLVQYLVNVLSSYLLNLIKHLRAFVSHRLILS